MTAITTAAHIDAQTQEELMRQAGIWIEHSTLIEDDLPARPLAAVQAEKHQLDRYTQLVADRAAARGSKCLAQPVAEICSASHDDAGAAPAAVAGPAWDKTRDSLAMLLLGLARRPFLDFDVACIALDAATEPGMPLAYMRCAPAAPALEAPAPVTLMTEDQASKWAWDQIREEVGTKGWTAGDSCNFFGFFLHGWNYRGQYELQRPAALARAALAAPAAPVVDVLSPERMREEFIAWAEVAYRHEEDFTKRDFEICLKAWRFGSANALLAAQAAAKGGGAS